MTDTAFKPGDDVFTPHARGTVIDIRPTPSGKWVFGVEDDNGEVSYFHQQSSPARAELESTFARVHWRIASRPSFCHSAFRSRTGRGTGWSPRRSGSCSASATESLLELERSRHHADY